MQQICAFWFRRDLRLHDNVGLYHALCSAAERQTSVLPVFIFDRAILDTLDDKHDQRVEFIHTAVSSLAYQLQQYGSSLLVRHGFPHEVWAQLLQEFPIYAVFANHDYEPYARKRDSVVRELFTQQGVQFQTFKDQVIFERDEILTSEHRPYTVFTPYSRRWKEQLTSSHLRSFDTEQYKRIFLQCHDPYPLPNLSTIGFAPSGKPLPPCTVPYDIIQHYDKTRDIPAKQGTTRLSVHLRFGTVSVRELVRVAHKLNEIWLNELIWREFYMQILWHFPHVEHASFKPEYDRITWRNDEYEFRRWCEGTTGYPLVDAGMRELNATGYMHNRVRMVAASFLTKHLLIDWRWGERYFAAKLLDFDLAANNGNWQWAAGTGCDAAPYFRIFSPEAQAAKFDPDKAYIRMWVPEYGMPSYPQPIVEHKAARARALSAYKQALENAKRFPHNS
ncbi:MAG: deoxyribodipyrimidine photo-lyase [Bacteroidota bacterium]|nr:DNA photolyase family protein [Candidatus Kapabacteria bacterium]MDW8220225.1 deoxyribodipyrimidine photo-lyase [Bacteroidota bacterium]